MPEPVKICPICDTVNHRNAMVCVTCGTTLTDVDAVGESSSHSANGYSYDFRYGETDLYEDALRRKGQVYLGVATLLLVVFMLIGAGLILSPMLTARIGQPGIPDNSGSPNDPNTNGESGNSDSLFITNTPRPTFILPTVTQGSPTSTKSPTPSVTPTETVVPTREPCIQVVGANDLGLFDLALRCGHSHLSVIDEIVRLNSLTSAESIRVGQSITIPWPTETLDPNAGSTAPEGSAPEAGLEGQTVMVSSDGLSPEEIAATQAVDPYFAPTETLPPGLMFHRVQAGDSLASIVYQYNTHIETMQQINPEIEFSQCDFGIATGGPRCTVLLGQGQLVRVPAPTPTPTLSRTPSGSETPTPTATPTFNAPSAINPGNRAYFRRDQFVTLRWVGSAALAPGQVYQVDVEDVTRGLAFSAQTTDLFFVLPVDWQGPERKGYEYTWTVSVINLDNPENPQYTTVPRTFTWEGLIEQTQEK